MAIEPATQPSFWSYFRSPFPRAGGFSAYRMPGMAVHLPVILFFLWLGAWACLGDAWLSPLFLLHVLIGIYVGRDVAILAHYNPLITIGVWLGGLLLLRYARIQPAGVLTGASVTAALAIAFVVYVSWYQEQSHDGAPGAPSGRFPLLKRLVDRIDDAALLPGDPPAVRLRKTLLIFLCSGCLLFAPWQARYLSQLQLALAVKAVLGLALLSLLALVLLLVTKRTAVATALQLTGLLLTPLLVHREMGGFARSGAIALWSFLSPLAALVLLGTGWAVAWFAAFAALLLAVAAREVIGGADPQVVLLFCENVLLVSSLAFVALRFFIAERDKAQAALAREQERSEQLLLNILPAPIAERLKNEQKTVADGYAEVSILFADIVGFTPLAASVSPERLVELLNSLFSRFDALCDEHGVEKIKTIGDAYMVCAGLPVPRADHAEALAEMALAMRAAVVEHNREQASSLAIRIGINSGLSSPASSGGRSSSTTCGATRSISPAGWNRTVSRAGSR
jgi:adenylate cyclase